MDNFEELVKAFNGDTAYYNEVEVNQDEMLKVHRSQRFEDIKLATIYFTAATIAMNDDLNLMQEADDSMDNATKSQKFEDMAMKILTDNKRLDRKFTMARAVGGLGVGNVVLP